MKNILINFMDTFIGIIPARYSSSRFPGKPLCDISGKPMIWHTYHSVIKWNYWKKVYLATDNEEIMNAAKKYEIPCVMTSKNCTDCLDRASEVSKILQSQNQGSDKYIIIQGDEPLFNVETLNVDLSPHIVNFYTEVQDQSELYDSNTVKVVVSKSKKALYFSRYSIPYSDERTKRSNRQAKIFKQIGVYVFSQDMLCKYHDLGVSYLEEMEGIGLNRLLENDIDISMRYTKYDSISVDVSEDRDRIVNLLKNKSI